MYLSLFHKDMHIIMTVPILPTSPHSQQIVDTVTGALERFRGDEAPEDDITLVVVKIDGVG